MMRKAAVGCAASALLFFTIPVISLYWPTVSICVLLFADASVFSLGYMATGISEGLAMRCCDDEYYSAPCQDELKT